MVASCAWAKDTRAKSRAMIASRGSSLVNWCCSPRKLLLSQPPPTRSPDDLSLRWRRCTGLVSTASVLNPYAHWDSQAYGPPRVHAHGRPRRFSVLTRGIAFGGVWPASGRWDFQLTLSFALVVGSARRLRLHNTGPAPPARRRRPSGLRPVASAAPVQGKGNRQALCGSQRVFYSLVYAVHVLFRLFRRVFSMYFQCISLKCAKLRACMGAGWSTSPNQEGTT